jgi:hypothetical protein
VLACARCGVAADGRPTTWSSELSDRGTSWLCERCTRENLRSIEARLGQEWW